ncbi:hypothetical protein BS78_01G160700 [Paspalum vaginatum]|nr:hypothetical protein BS78_01G160700 [Paspalum vaginatum]
MHLGSQPAAYLCLLSSSASCIQRFQHSGRSSSRFFSLALAYSKPFSVLPLQRYGREINKHALNIPSRAAALDPVDLGGPSTKHHLKHVDVIKDKISVLPGIVVFL